MRTPFGRRRRPPPRALILTAAAAAFCMLAFWPGSGSAAGGEAATSHRAGDLIVYRFACHDADSMIALAERGGAGALAAALVLRGECFQNSGCIAATLEGWVAGPYPPPRGTPGSVWRVRDQLGDTEFVWIDDGGGPHLPAPPMPHGLRQGAPPEPRFRRVTPPEFQQPRGGPPMPMRRWWRRREMAL